MCFFTCACLHVLFLVKGKAQLPRPFSFWCFVHMGMWNFPLVYICVAIGSSIVGGNALYPCYLVTKFVDCDEFWCFGMDIGLDKFMKPSLMLCPFQTIRPQERPLLSIRIHHNQQTLSPGSMGTKHSPLRCLSQRLHRHRQEGSFTCLCAQSIKKEMVWGAVPSTCKPEMV